MQDFRRDSEIRSPRFLHADDILNVVNLDRAFRSAIDALRNALNLREPDILFDTLTFPIDLQCDIGEVFYGILTLFDQLERSISAHAHR